MKILFINTTGGTASHGNICFELAKKHENKGDICRIAYGRNPSQDKKFKEFGYRIGNKFDIIYHVLLTRLFDKHGLGSKQATKKFITWANEYNPDLVWLHNIHGYYLNYEILFNWIKSRPHMNIKWTLHDCWAFTGHCAHFTVANCNKWEKKCICCPQKREYPASLFRDNCKRNYDKKKRAFIKVKNMVLITPSIWLKDLVSQSFLKDYNVQVIYNTINTKVFKATPSDFRKKYNLEDKKIILGVANIWNERKGLYDFIELAEMLTNRYVIILVGIKEKQLKIAMKRNNYLKNKKEIKNCHKKKPKKLITEKTFSMYENVNKEGFSHQGFEDKGGIAIYPSVESLYKTITGEIYDNKKGNKKADIMCLPRTDSAYELAIIYSASDMFCNPTHEDNYPTVNIEAQACGTYVITYNVGGAKETLKAFR